MSINDLIKERLTDIDLDKRIESSFKQFLGETKDLLLDESQSQQQPAVLPSPRDSFAVSVVG